VADCWHGLTWVAVLSVAKASLVVIEGEVGVARSGKSVAMTLDGNLDDGPSVRWRVCASHGWLSWSVVSNVTMFHDDIGAFVMVFGRLTK
jgi:hypothetical protein